MVTLIGDRKIKIRFRRKRRGGEGIGMVGEDEVRGG